MQPDESEVATDATQQNAAEATTSSGQQAYEDATTNPEQLANKETSDETAQKADLTEVRRLVPVGFPKVIDRITNPDASPAFSFEEEDLLDIWFPPIRDQDCAIFIYLDQVWMLDCGDERAKDQIVPLLKELGITRTDRLFNTHPHHDHLNGLYAIDSVCPIGELLICFPEDSTRHMTAAMEYCKGNGIPITRFDDESVFNMGDGLVTFTAWQKTSEDESVNDRSAQFMVTYGDCNMLFMADMELRGQRQLLEAMAPSLLKADILRYPHHGKMHMNDELFIAIDPSLAVITNATKGIDLKDSTKFLAYKHVPAAYTNLSDAVIHLTTDGSHWLCELVPFTLPPRSAEEEVIEESEDDATLSDPIENEGSQKASTKNDVIEGQTQSDQVIVP